MKEDVKLQELKKQLADKPLTTVFKAAFVFELARFFAKATITLLVLGVPLLLYIVFMLTLGQQ